MGLYDIFTDIRKAMENQEKNLITGLFSVNWSTHLYHDLPVVLQHTYALYEVTHSDRHHDIGVACMHGTCREAGLVGAGSLPHRCPGRDMMDHL
jgi:hypothetical protein